MSEDGLKDDDDALYETDDDATVIIPCGEPECPICHPPPLKEEK